MRTVRSTSRRWRAIVVVLVLLGAAPSIVLGSSPDPQESMRYVTDRILVRFRGVPSETDLEILRGRQFLTEVEYIQGDYPPRMGWYVFRIDDGRDALIVRDLLRKDALVCNAELVARGERHAIGIPKADEAPPCEASAAQATPYSDDGSTGRAGTEPSSVGPGSLPFPANQAAAPGIPILVVAGSAFVAIVSWLGLRRRRQPRAGSAFVEN